MIYYVIQKCFLSAQIILALYTLYVFGCATKLTSVKGVVTFVICAVAMGDFAYISFVMQSPQTKDLISSNFFWFGVRNAISLLYWERWAYHVYKLVKTC